MPHASNATELQLKTVQRNYESISKMMHSKQQECDKVSDATVSYKSPGMPVHCSCSPGLQITLELEGARRQLEQSVVSHQQETSRADNADARILVICSFAPRSPVPSRNRWAAGCCINALSNDSVVQELEAKLQDEAQLYKTLQRANLEAAAAAQQQTALKQHVIQ